jgi:hypothetical protein
LSFVYGQCTSLSAPPQQRKEHRVRATLSVADMLKIVTERRR